MTDTDWKTQKLWRSWIFVVHLVYSTALPLFRMFAIKHHEKDIGTWIRKDWQMLFLKLGRICFLVPVIVIYVTNVRDIVNPRIINSVFYQECTMTPSYNPELLQYLVVSTYPWSQRCHPSPLHHMESSMRCGLLAICR